MTLSAGPSYHLVKDWDGSGSKTTETFTIESNQWYIDWRNYSDSHFAIEVYKADGTYVGLVGNVVKQGQDRSYQHAPGDDYLVITGGEEWWVGVQEQTE